MSFFFTTVQVAKDELQRFCRGESRSREKALEDATHSYSPTLFNAAPFIPVRLPSWWTSPLRILFHVRIQPAFPCWGRAAGAGPPEPSLLLLLSPPELLTSQAALPFVRS